VSLRFVPPTLFIFPYKFYLGGLHLQPDPKMSKCSVLNKYNCLRGGFTFEFNPPRFHGLISLNGSTMMHMHGILPAAPGLMLVE
jgi:hypothetical protein